MIKYDKLVVIALKKSEEEAFNLSHKIVGIEHFILATLSFKNNIKAILNKYGVTYEKYKEKLNNYSDKNNNKNKYIFYSFNLKKVIDIASDNTKDFLAEEVTLEHIYMSIIEEDNDIGIKMLKEFNIDLDKFYKDVIKLLKNNKNLLIYEIGTNLNELAINKKLDKVIGRKKEINNIIEILARKNKNNPLLIGEAGVGKTALIEGLADLISKNNVPDFLKNTTVVSLNIASVISGTKYRGEFEEKLTKILKECEEVDNIIIFIDEVHTIVGAGGAEGAIDASNILKPILARGNIKIIGATTISEYKKFIATDKALDRRFQKVYVNEPNEEETYNILKKIKPDYEKFHNVKISNDILKNILYLSNKYIFDRNEPDKSIDILDEVCAATAVTFDNKNLVKHKNELKSILIKKQNAIKNGDYVNAEILKEKEQEILMNIKNSNEVKEVTIETLKKIIESKCNSKIYDLNNSGNIYNDIELYINEKIVGQKKAIKDLLNILKIFNLKKEKNPTSILIYGSSGIGKSLAIKELSKINNYNLIKLDMSDFSTEISINKLIGSPQGYIGYNDNNTSLEEIKLKPNSIILLEGIDKAHPSVINLFLNILDEGILKNSKNEILNFNNSIIIMTSNNLKCSSLGYLKDSNNVDFTEIFSNEFINRINYTIKFKNLTKNDIKKIIEKKVDNIKSNYNKSIILNNKIIDSIISESNYKELGARNLDNILKKHVEKILISSCTL